MEQHENGLSKKVRKQQKKQIKMVAKALPWFVPGFTPVLNQKERMEKMLNEVEICNTPELRRTLRKVFSKNRLKRRNEKQQKEKEKDKENMVAEDSPKEESPAGKDMIKNKQAPTKGASPAGKDMLKNKQAPKAPPAGKDVKKTIQAKSSCLKKNVVQKKIEVQKEIKEDEPMDADSDKSDNDSASSRPRTPEIVPWRIVNKCARLKGSTRPLPAPPAPITTSSDIKSTKKTDKKKTTPEAKAKSAPHTEPKGQPATTTRPTTVLTNRPPIQPSIRPPTRPPATSVPSTPKSMISAASLRSSAKRLPPKPPGEWKWNRMYPKPTDWEHPKSTLVEFLQHNPKKQNSFSYARYESYKAAKTFEEFFDLWGWSGDFLNDFKKGYVKILKSEDERTSTR